MRNQLLYIFVLVCDLVSSQLFNFLFLFDLLISSFFFFYKVNIEYQGRRELEGQLANLQDEVIHYCRQISLLQQEHDQLRNLLDEQEELGEQQRHGLQQEVDAAKMSASAEVKVRIMILFAAAC